MDFQNFTLHTFTMNPNHSQFWALFIIGFAGFIPDFKNVVFKALWNSWMVFYFSHVIVRFRFPTVDTVHFEN